MIKVLFLAADPADDAARLRLDEEIRAIDAAIQRSTHREALQFAIHFAVRIRDLLPVLLRHEPLIVHFSGHGDGAGGIELGDEAGKPRKVDREALTALFGALEHPPRVVVLNACSTGDVEAADDGVADFTIGMDRPVEDTSAIAFAEAFYGALAAGETVARAFKQGTAQLRMEGVEVIPTLHVRPGVDLDLVLVLPDERGDGEEDRGEDAEHLVVENVLNTRDRDPTKTQVHTFRHPSGRVITFRNG